MRTEEAKRVRAAIEAKEAEVVARLVEGLQEGRLMACSSRFANVSFAVTFDGSEWAVRLAEWDKHLDIVEGVYNVVGCVDSERVDTELQAMARDAVSQIEDIVEVTEMLLTARKFVKQCGTGWVRIYLRYDGEWRLSHLEESFIYSSAGEVAVGSLGERMTDTELQRMAQWMIDMVLAE